MPFAKSGGLFDDNPAATHDSAVRGGKVMIAHIDGGARGNPGPAGYGAYITDGEGRKLAELSDFLGVQTNNFAEYSGLVAALEYAVEHGYGTVKVVSDSELLVKQMKGQYKVRSEALTAIYNEARALVRKLDRFEIRHVLRHLNKDADRLANQAMDRGMGRRATAQGKAPGEAKRSEAPASPAAHGEQRGKVYPAGADAFATPPAVSPPAPREEMRELRGFVRGGVVEFTGEKFPDGVFVIVRRAR
jgi:ribonuclease HI